MPELFIVRWNNLYFHSFSLELSPLWIVTPEEAKPFQEEEARRWIKALETVFELSGLEMEPF